MNSELPKLCCFSIRSVIICFAVVSASIYFHEGLTTYSDWKRISDGVIVTLHCFTIYGVVKVNQLALKCSLCGLVVFLSALLFVFLTIPIYTASLYASTLNVPRITFPGTSHNITMILGGKVGTPDQSFKAGLVMGYTFQVALALYFLFHLAQFLLVKKFYSHVTTYRFEKARSEDDV